MPLELQRGQDAGTTALGIPQEYADRHQDPLDRVKIGRVCAVGSSKVNLAVIGSPGPVYGRATTDPAVGSAGLRQGGNRTPGRDQPPAARSRERVCSMKFAPPAVLIVCLGLAGCGEDSGNTEQGPTTTEVQEQLQQQDQEALSGKVQFEVLSAREGMGDPYVDEVSVFDDRRFFVSVRYRLTNGTDAPVTPAFSLATWRGGAVRGIERGQAAGVPTIESGETSEGEVLFGFGLSELQQLPLLVEDIRSGKVIYARNLKNDL